LAFSVGFEDRQVLTRRKWEEFKNFLSSYLFAFLDGLKSDEWLQLLEENRFAIDPPYWPRAALITLASLFNSVSSWIEKQLLGPALAKVTIPPPLFILGHWRNGTTLLHHLLAVDPQFAYPNLYQVCNPHTFLFTEAIATRLLGCLVPQRRLQDNVAVRFAMPMEDEFALMVATLCSPYSGWVFQRNYSSYQRYLTFRGVAAEEVQVWKNALTLFVKKLTWKYSRPLLLKSPPHTSRIRLLLEMFPQARFVHIHRNPYRVFQSTRYFRAAASPYFNLQRPDWKELSAQIIDCYQAMYEAFFEDRGLIPQSQFHETCFEELERDPVAQIETIYKSLGLTGFQAVLPSLRCYLDSITAYRRNEYPDLAPSVRDHITQAWKRCFEEWGYSCH
jgi:hypothetical protein